MSTFKMAVSTIADRYGLAADFSPMPLPDMPGNGFHINLYVTSQTGEDMAAMAAAGILEKIRDMTLFLNPTDSSYARLGHSAVSGRVNWSSSGESELLYLETYKGRTRVELRSPDAGGNPYLIYALLIHAGLYGIENQLSLPGEWKEGGLFLPASRKEAGVLARKSEFIKGIVLEGILNSYMKI